MQWILENWVLVVFGGGMVAMHLFGHRSRGAGGHGGGGGCCGGKSKREPDPSPDLLTQAADDVTDRP